MQIGKWKGVDEAKSCFMIGLSFPGEPCDDVGTNGGVRKKFADEIYTASIMFSAIPAVHSGENIVGAGLQRHVKVVGDAICAGKERDEVLRDVERFDGTDSKTRQRSLVENTAKEVQDVRARREVAAPRAEIDSAEHNFLKAGVTKAIDF